MARYPPSTHGYCPLSTNTQLVLGVDTTGQSPITFGLASKIVLMRMSAAGTGSFTDVGIDTQHQYLGDPHIVTLSAAWTLQQV